MTKRLTIRQTETARAELIDQAMTKALETFGVFTIAYIASESGVTRQKVVARIRLFEAAGTAYCALSMPGATPYKVWAAGAYSVFEDRIIRDRVAALQYIPPLQVPNTPYKTTFVNNINPWTKVEVKINA